MLIILGICLENVFFSISLVSIFRGLIFNCLSSLGNENGVLIGFKPDYIKIYSDEEIIKKDVIIGIYDGALSKTNLYTSLIGLGCFKKEGMKDEYITST